MPVKPGDDKPKRLTKSEREVFSLGQEQKDILIGVLLGDLNIRKRFQAGNPVLRFVQGLVHKDYIYHLYELARALVLFLYNKNRTRATLFL